MGPDFRFIFGNRLKHFGDTVTDIVFYDISYKEHGKEHSYTRIYKVKNIVGPIVGQSHKTMMNKVNAKF